MYNIINSMKKEMLRRRFSIKTIQSYIFCIEKFLKKVNNPKRIRKSEIKEFLNDLSERKRAGSTMNVYLSAIKFLVNDVLRKNINLNLRYSKTPKRLPIFLTRDELRRLFQSIENPKHKLMIELMYSAGLRVSELLHLRARDFEVDMGYGWIRKGKGNKDRPFIIAKRLKDEIVYYIIENKLTQDDFLFARNRVIPLTVRTVQEILKKAAKKAGIKKKVHPHMLRHSFGTHLVEEENDLIDVQKLLGHNDVKTTMVYVHTASPKMISVESPFDNL
jgi:site-specific recombinase XerD